MLKPDNLSNQLGLSHLPTSSYEFGGQSYTTQELWCKISEKINIIIEHFNYLDKDTANKYDTLLREVEELKKLINIDNNNKFMFIQLLSDSQPLPVIGGLTFYNGQWLKSNDGISWVQANI